MTRKAIVRPREGTSPQEMHERVSACLPSNYTAEVGRKDGWVEITGEDGAGWTMHGYVIPRLASGLIWAQEVQV